MEGAEIVTDYASAGVDRKGREQAKKAWAAFATAKGMIKTPFNALYHVTGDLYQVKTCDGVGTKVMLAEAANKHDTIGIDAVAMVVNDALRCGAKPVALTNTIDVKKSTPELLTELAKGLAEGARQAGCPMVGGETADVPELMSALYHINCDCVANVRRKDIITGARVKAGDTIAGFPSSGLHSNGISLARRALFKQWGGKYDLYDRPAGLKRELIYEALEPTRIYVDEFLKLDNIKGAVHITGDAYLKFLRFGRGLGFEFDNFKPQPIFEFIREAGKVKTEEMFRTFNMGWGFAVITDDPEPVLKAVKGAEIIGAVNKSGRVRVHYDNKVFEV